MFYFDMLVHGVRGESLGDMMDNEELEVYGIDWEALQDDDIRQSHLIQNGIQEGSTSWIGHIGPPPDLNEVCVDSPNMPFNTQEELDMVYLSAQPWIGRLMMSQLHKRGYTHLLLLSRSMVHFREIYLIN